jgi:hypothetical protein
VKGQEARYFPRHPPGSSHMVRDDNLHYLEKRGATQIHLMVPRNKALGAWYNNGSRQEDDRIEAKAREPDHLYNMCPSGFNGEFFVFGKHPPLLFCCVWPLLFVTASAIIPVTESLDRRKGMAAGAEDTARSYLLEKDGFVRRFIIYQIFRQYDLRNVNAFSFLFIQPL